MSTKIESSSPYAHASAASAARPNGAKAAASEAAATPPAARTEDTVRLTGDAMQMQELERSLAKTAAVDVKRVDEVRRAIAEGRYQVDPERIAAKLLQSERSLGY